MNVVLLFQKSKTNKKLWLTWALFPALFALTVLFLPVTRDADAMLGKFPPFEQKMSININRGSYLIGVFNLSCEHCQETARELAVLQKSGIQLPQVVALFFDEGDTTVEAFNALTDSQFPYQRIEANTFFDLIGSAPPRVYWIKDGTINQFWDNDITAGIKATFVP